MVVGGGSVILLERARFYGRAGLPTGVRAMYSLLAVNIVVMTYIAATLVARWHSPLSWRTYLAVFVFALKAVFFRQLRILGVAQEERLAEVESAPPAL
jgi:hypothetical protein